MATFFYRSLKKYTAFALGFYFKKWQVHGENNIPDCPVIFVPNHQNAFLDAVLVTCSSKKNPWFLTRANVFENKTAAWMLHQMQMLPVYRFRDGYSTLKKNEQVMDDVVRKINNGDSVLIFAEGNHGDRYQLRPLQKGVARIALAVDKNVNVAIVPVGLQYDSRTAFRSRVLVNFGKPLFVIELDLPETGSQSRFDALLMTVRMHLQPLVLHIESHGYDEKWEYLQRNRRIHENLHDQLLSDQEIAAAYPAPQPQLQPSSTTPAWKNIIMWYIKINAVIPIFLIKKLILANIKDPQFTGSVKFAAGMFLTPFFWVLQALLVFYFSGSLLLAFCYFISLPAAIRIN